MDKRRAAACLSLLLCSCTAQSQLQPQAGRIFRPSEVVRDARALAGREIRVTGQLAYHSHARILWDSAAAARRRPRGPADAFGACLTLIQTGPHDRFMRRNNGRTVTLRGIVRLNVLEGHVDFGACGETGLELVPPPVRR